MSWPSRAERLSPLRDTDGERARRPSRRGQSPRRAQGNRSERTEPMGRRVGPYLRARARPSLLRARSGPASHLPTAAHRRELRQGVPGPAIRGLCEREDDVQGERARSCVLSARRAQRLAARPRGRQARLRRGRNRPDYASDGHARACFALVGFVPVTVTLKSPPPLARYAAMSSAERNVASVTSGRSIRREVRTATASNPASLSAVT